MGKINYDGKEIVNALVNVVDLCVDAFVDIAEANGADGKCYINIVQAMAESVDKMERQIGETKKYKIVHKEPKTFIVGDKVCVRTDLEIGKVYGMVMWTDERRDAVENALDYVYPSPWLEVERIHGSSNTCKLRGCKDWLYSFDMLELYKHEGESDVG